MTRIHGQYDDPLCGMQSNAAVVYVVRFTLDSLLSVLNMQQGCGNVWRLVALTTELSTVAPNAVSATIRALLTYVYTKCVSVYTHRAESGR
jgi:hypothetical protein